MLLLLPPSEGKTPPGGPPVALDELAFPGSLGRVRRRLPRLGAGLAATWRPAVTDALAPRDVPDELIVDLRSGPYSAVWRPRSAQHLVVRAFRIGPDGSRQVISHMAKASRGDVARALLRARRIPRTPQDVADIAATAGLRVELDDGNPATLAVLEGP